MATILDTLITRFGFETDTSGADEAEKKITDFKKTALKAAAGIGAVLGGAAFLKSTAAAADETLKFADSVGVAVESLGELEFATQRQGGSVEGLRSSLQNVGRAIGEVERGVGRAKAAFEDYGISIKDSNGQTKTADQLLIELNQKFAGLSRAQQFDLAAKMGIDQGTIRLLQTAPDEVSRLRMEASKLGVLSRQDAAAAAEFQDGLTNMAQAMNAIKFEIGGMVFGPLSKFFKLIASGIAFFRRHKEVLLSIMAILGLVGLAYAAMGAKAAIAWAITLGPLIAIPAAIALVGAALAILTEDFIAFFKGQESAIGKLVEKWPILGDIIYTIRDTFIDLWEMLKIAFEFWAEWLPKIGKGMKEFLLDPLIKVIGFLNKIPGLAKALQAIVPGGALIGKAVDFLKGPELAPAAPMAGPVQGGATVSRSSSVSISELKIEAPGADSKEIAQNIQSELRDQLQNAVEDTDSDIER